MGSAEWQLTECAAGRMHPVLTSVSGPVCSSPPSHACRPANTPLTPHCISFRLAMQTNLMVLGAGGYRNLDFVKFGGPMQLFMLVVTSIILVSGPPIPLFHHPGSPSCNAPCAGHFGCTALPTAVLGLHGLHGSPCHPPHINTPPAACTPRQLLPLSLTLPCRWPTTAGTLCGR